MQISISPVPAFPNPAVSLVVSDGQVNLGVGANFQYVLIDANGRAVAPTGRMALTPAQYAAWGESDEAVAVMIAENLGLTYAPA